MPSIATCPECAEQFALPEYAVGEDRAKCPKCEAEFLVADAHQRQLPVAKILEPQLELPAEAEPEEPIAVPEFSPAFRSAETISDSGTMSGWEQRLKKAIETTASEPSGELQSDSSESGSVSLESAPKFEFHMDPPLESPSQSSSASSLDLPDAEQWDEEMPAVFREEPPPEAVAAIKPAPALRKRRTGKSSFVNRASVVVVFGLIGLVLGQYALLWIRGPSADFLNIAGFLPSAIQPTPTSQILAPQLHREPSLASDSAPSETPELEPPREELPLAESTIEREPAPPVGPPPITRDDEVQPAMAEMLDTRLLASTHTTYAEFAELVTGAEAAAPVLVSGDLKTLESARAKGHAYMAFCQLAERFDFVNELGLAIDAQHEATSAQALFRTTAAKAAPQNDFAVIVTRWWQHLERPEQGIFLVGRVQDVQTVGSHSLYQVAVVHAAESTLIPVLLDKETYQAGDQIGVVGTIVAEPRTVLRDFQADVPQLVVAQDSFVVPAG